MNDDLQRLIDDVRLLLANASFEEAIDRLKTATHAQPGDFYNEMILQEAHYRRTERSYRRSLITHEQHERELNLLTGALLDTVDDFARRLKTSSRIVQPLSHPQPPPPTEQITTQPVMRPQQILGINNLKQISWIETGLRAARSVCRVLTPNGMGTGFVVGPGLLMTNNHVIPTTAVAAESQAEFDYQQDSRGGFLRSTRYGLDPGQFQTHPTLDYTIVGIVADAAKPQLTSWGQLSLNANADPTPAELVVIVQHPNGGYKQIAMSANAILAIDSPLLRYTTDTMPGSSGAPVFNDSWHVIAIHHAGGVLEQDGQGGHRYVNEGVLMSAIRAHAGPNWPQ